MVNHSPGQLDPMSKATPKSKFLEFVKIANLFTLLASDDIKQAYRRSVVGPFWITAAMAVQITTMGIVFGLIFKSETEDYIPFLSVSIILWGLISSTLNDSCLAFISAEGMIRQIRLPFSIHVLRVVWKNILGSLHNLAILPIVFLLFPSPLSWTVGLFLPGALLVVGNLIWISFLLALFSARFRDLPPIVSSLSTIAFYVTPVMWYPNLLPGGTAHLLLGLNPFYHLLQIVRLPLLGQTPTMENWLLSFILLCLGAIVASLVFRKMKSQIAYWV